MKTFTRYLSLLLFASLSFIALGQVKANNQGPIVTPILQRALPTKFCTNAPSHKGCHRGAPAIADIDGDGIDDIIVVTHNGYILAIKYDGTPDGQLLWQRDVSPYFGMAAGKMEISSSPAIGDIDNDGFPEIVVGTGTLAPYVYCTPGGIIALEHDGTVKAGWPVIALDIVDHPGCTNTPESVYSTPALADVDGDGDMEIFIGGYDKRIYGLHHDGTFMAGFPVDSAHKVRFPDWPQFNGALADSIWSSPAIGDIDGDGQLDIVIGSDEGNFDSRYGGDSGGWTCPYAAPAGIAEGYCGGSIYAIDRFGQLIPGFPRYYHEIIQSTPALFDYTTDGIDEIFHGTGSFYYLYSADKPTEGFRIYGMEGDGTDLSNWTNGKSLNGVSAVSVAVGDITGGPDPEIVIGDYSGWIHAFSMNGSIVPGFPVRAKDQYNNWFKYDVPSAIILADFTGNGKNEIIFPTSWVITIINGQGQQLTTNSYPADPRPMYYMEELTLNSVAVGDVDGDGKLELIAHNSRLKVWDMSPNSERADWPMFKQNPLRTSRVQLDALDVQPKSFSILTDAVNQQQVFEVIVKNTGPGEINWSSSKTGAITVNPASGMVSNSEQTVIVRTGNLAIGSYDYTLTITAAETVPGKTTIIPIHVEVVNEVFRTNLPLMTKK